MGTIKKLKSKLSARGSVLVFTLIVLFIILASAIGISSVSVLERKGAGSTDVSVQSFQTANSGAEIILKKIDANKSGTFADIGCTSDNGGKISGEISSGKNYEITFYTSDGLPITDCAAVVSEVDKIKSIGSYANTTRAIEVAVAGGWFEIEQAIGYRAYDDDMGFLSRLNTIESFANIFEPVAFDESISRDIDDKDNFGLQGYDVPFNWEVRVGKGLRCKSENGWYLSGCNYANSVGVDGITDFDSAVIKNSCVAGVGDIAQEMEAPSKGGVSVSCMRISR